MSAFLSGLPDEQLLLLPPIDDVTGAKSRAPDYRGQKALELVDILT